jgi:hypothetical protein
VILAVHTEPGGRVVARELPITEAQCRAYADGAFLQDAFPDLSPQDREFIKSGFSLDPPESIDRWHPVPAHEDPFRTYDPCTMEPNPNGHAYGCGCPECMDFYRSLK